MVGELDLIGTFTLRVRLYYERRINTRLMDGQTNSDACKTANQKCHPAATSTLAMPTTSSKPPAYMGWRTIA